MRIVALSPGDRIVRASGQRRQRKRYYRPCLSWDLHERVRQLEELLEQTRAELGKL